jgi:hypothetical protein
MLPIAEVIATLHMYVKRADEVRNCNHRAVQAWDMQPDRPVQHVQQDSAQHHENPSTLHHHKCSKQNDDTLSTQFCYWKVQTCCYRALANSWSWVARPPRLTSSWMNSWHVATQASATTQPYQLSTNKPQAGYGGNARTQNTQNTQTLSKHTNTGMYKPVSVTHLRTAGPGWQVLPSSTCQMTGNQTDQTDLYNTISPPTPHHRTPSTVHQQNPSVQHRKVLEHKSVLAHRSVIRTCC